MSIDLVWPELNRELTLSEELSQARPREQVEILRAHADKLNIIVGELFEAEGLVNLMDEKMNLGDSEGLRHYGNQFEILIEKLQRMIERRQFELNEEALQLMADIGKATKESLARATETSKRARSENKEDRHAEAIKEAEDLIIETGLYGTALVKRLEIKLSEFFSPDGGRGTKQTPLGRKSLTTILKENGLYDKKQ